MSQQLPSWRSEKGHQTSWLFRLIEAMERFSQPEWRARPVDRRDRIALVAQLARPAMAYARRPRDLK